MVKVAKHPNLTLSNKILEWQAHQKQKPQKDAAWRSAGTHQKKISKKHGKKRALYFFVEIFADFVEGLRGHFAVQSLYEVGGFSD